MCNIPYWHDSRKIYGNARPINIIYFSVTEKNKKQILI